MFYAVNATEAQTINWLVKPKMGVEYSWMLPNVIKTKIQGKYGLIDTEGNTKLTAQYDQVTGFYSGMALILKRADSGAMIVGNIDKNGNVKMFDQDYYVSPGNTFYSEGLLAVKSRNGLIGFADKEGNLVIPFKYSDVMPFSEGYACVWGKGGDFFFIRQDGSTYGPVLPGGGMRTNGTSFHNGTCYVADEDDVWFEINSKGDIRRTSQVNANTPLDFLGRVLTEAPSEVPYETNDKSPKPQAGLNPIEENGKWGIKLNEKIIVQPQFDNVSKILGGIAMVKNGDAVGLLHITTGGEPFDVRATNVSHQFYPGQECKCSFIVDVPEGYHSKQLKVSVLEDGSPIDFTINGNEYAMTCHPKNSGTRTFDVSIETDGIHLWSGSIDYNFTLRKQQLRASLSVTGTDADINGRIGVVATIHNPNPVDVTATVHLRGSAALHSVSTTINIPAHGNRQVSSFFSVSKALPNQWVEVSTSEGGYAERRGLDLVPKE